MSLTLRQKQSLFVQLVGRLIHYAYSQGHELTFGEAHRSPEEAARLAASGKCIKNSLHGDRLAIDLNLFINGTYRRSTEAHRPLGDYWESLHPDCRWGGHFGDGNHYSFTHGGRK